MENINKYGQYKILDDKLSVFDIIVRFFNSDIDMYYIDDNGEFILEYDKNGN